LPSYSVPSSVPNLHLRSVYTPPPPLAWTVYAGSWKKAPLVRSAFVLGVIFLVIGFVIYLAGAGYGALRGRLKLERGARCGVSAPRGVVKAR